MLSLLGCWIGLVLICTATGVLGQSTDPDQGREENVVSPVSVESFGEFVNDKNVKILYFYKRNIPKMKKFMKEYEKSASYLSIYDVAFGWVDCTTDNVKGYCDREGIETEILAFKDGELLLDLTLETMFDVNSMVSNVLQIVLLREVPILQTRLERQEYEIKNKGKKHIFFGYFPAIGTREHRIFMEVAYSYRNEHIFALTTERETVTDLNYSKKQSSVWCLRCKDVPADEIESCKVQQFQRKFSLVLFANFVKSMSHQPYYELNKIEDLEMNPFQDAEMHLAIIFYNSNSEEKARRTTEYVSMQFLGVIGFILCNTDKVDASQFGLFENTGPLPLLAILFRNEDDPVFMDQLDLEEHSMTFIKQELNKREPEEGQAGGGNDIDVDDHNDSDGSDANDPSEIEKLDDQVALGAYSVRKHEVKTKFTVLNDKNFHTEIENKELTIVLFHLPFDIQSQAFMHVYAEAANTLKQDSINVLAALNCYDWTDVCTKLNVTSYPLITFYRKGKKPTPYKGLLDYSALINTVKLYLAKAPQTLLTEEDVKSFGEGLIPENIGFFTNTSVVGMATTNPDIALFKEVAEIIHGSIICGLVTGIDLANQIARKFNCQPPCIVLHKRDDLYQPYLVVKQETSASRLVQFIRDARIPKFSQISVDTFPAFYARRQPMVILFDTGLKPKEGLHKIIGTVASSDKFPSVIFTFIDLNKQKDLGGNLLSHYQLGTKLPLLLLVNVHEHTIHKYHNETINEQGVSAWVQKVLEGAYEPDRLMEKKHWFPRHPGYDYLSMLDEEQKQSISEVENEGDANAYDEENLGFDEDGEEVGHEYDGGTGAAGDGSVEPEDDIEQDLHDLKKSRLFQTRDAGSTDQNRNIPSTAESRSEYGYEHNEL